MGSMNTKAPDNDSERVTHVVAYIPIEEWRAHKERVEAMINLLNGVFNGMATNPMLKSILPPDVLQQMAGKL